jgi:hypothetical protein
MIFNDSHTQKCGTIAIPIASYCLSTRSAGFPFQLQFSIERSSGLSPDHPASQNRWTVCGSMAAPRRRPAKPTTRGSLHKPFLRSHTNAEEG